MRLAAKQLFRQLGKNRVLVLLMFLLMFLTSLSFYFVRFSVDGNQKLLNRTAFLTENQRLYQIALRSNASLAYVFWFFLAALTGFVIVMFFYRFLHSHQKTIGCLKALGFQDDALRLFFTGFIAILALSGALAGLLGGYVLSDVLLDAGRRAYAVTVQVKAIGAVSVLVGVAVSTMLFSGIAYFCYLLVRDREPGLLISGSRSGGGIPRVTMLADRAARMLPVKNKLAVRIALQKPVALILIAAAVMSFNVCMILGRSLNISSRQVFQMQTKGHNYDYETEYSDFRTGAVPERALPYVAVSSAIRTGGREISQTLVGLYESNPVYELESGGVPLTEPEPGTVYINPGLREVYGVKAGDTVKIELKGIGYDYRVSAIAFNAQADTVYLAAPELTERLGLPAGAYNRILGLGEPTADHLKTGAQLPAEAVRSGQTRTRAERLEELDRDAVSNQISAVINQVTGAAVGCILLFLALYINFQDNIRDMLILHMSGYQEKEIRALLVDIYLPAVQTVFLITLLPAAELVKAIQRSLSVSTGDYMPFGTSVSVIVFTGILLHVIYWLVQQMFSVGIRQIKAKGNMAEFTSFE